MLQNKSTTFFALEIVQHQDDLSVRRPLGSTPQLLSCSAEPMRIWHAVWLLAAPWLALADQQHSTCPLPIHQSFQWPTCSPDDVVLPDASGAAVDRESDAIGTNPPSSHGTTAGEIRTASVSEGSGSSTVAAPSEGSGTAAAHKQTHFPSFNEWKDQHDTHHSLRERLAKASISKAVVTDASSGPEGTPAPNLAGEPSNLQENATTELDKPISYIHPLPFSGTGQPEDPLTPLSARTNYASFDCSAAVLQSSKQTKGASSILNNSKDRYMLTPCDAPENFVIIELCEEIDVDALVLANWEFFSSMFKHFQVSGSEVYPGRPEDWLSLGLFRAGNVRAPQVCLWFSTSFF